MFLICFFFYLSPHAFFHLFSCVVLYVYHNRCKISLCDSIYCKYGIFKKFGIMMSPARLSSMDELLLYSLNGSANVACKDSLEMQDCSFFHSLKNFFSIQ